MAAVETPPSRYVICLNAECEVFAARQIDRVTQDGTLIERTRAPVGSATDIGPDRCLARLVTADRLPESARLGHWHPAEESADIVGYWTVDTT